jgi:hypothetical protein
MFQKIQPFPLFRLRSLPPPEVMSTRLPVLPNNARAPSSPSLAKLGGPHGNNEESAYKYKLHGELTGDDAHWWPPEDGGQRGCLPVLNTRMTAAHSETRLHELSRHTP